MEGETNSIPSFARGLNILLVDHDTISLMYLASLLEQYSFKVTTTELASIALSMIREQEDRFKLVVANVNMPDMDSLSFLRILLRKDIPVILMSSEKNVNVAKKAIADGACYFLEKPIVLEDLKYVWQHAYLKRLNPMKEIQKANNEGKVNRRKESQGIKIKEAAGGVSRPHQQHMVMDPKGKNKQIEVDVGMVDENHAGELQNSCIEELLTSKSNEQGGIRKTKRSNEDNHEGEQQEKRTKLSSEQNNCTGMQTVEEEGVERKDNSNSSTERRPRFVWSPELHLKFTAALSTLGDKDARPKTILKMMSVPELTLRQVASHLQKYKAQVQRINETGATNLPSVSKSTRLEKQRSLPSQLGCESYIFGNGGNTTKIFPPNFLTNGNLHAGHFLNHNSGYAGFSGNPNSYLFSNTNGVLTDAYGEFQTLNHLWETNSFPYHNSMNGIGNGKQPQVPELDLPNLSCMNLETAFPYFSAETFQFPTAAPDLFQELDFSPPLAAAPFIPPNENQFSMEFMPGQLTSGGTTEPADEFPSDFTNGSQELEAKQALLASSPNQNQPLIEYADLLKALEEEPEEFSGFGSTEPNLGEVDRYCEWLRKTLLENPKDLE